MRYFKVIEIDDLKKETCICKSPTWTNAKNIIAKRQKENLVKNVQKTYKICTVFDYYEC